MKRILQKSLFRLRALLLLAVMFVVGGSAWAENRTVTLSFAETLTPSEGDISARADYRDGGGAGVYSPLGSNYGNLVVTSNDGNIVKIVLHFGSSENVDELTCTPGQLTAQDTWEGDAESVTFHGGQYYRTIVISSIEVTYKYEPLVSPIDYQIIMNNAPAGAEVYVDGHTYFSSTTHSVLKKLKADAFSHNDVIGYWSEANYDAANTTYTVNYYPYYYYDVTVEGGDGNGYIQGPNRRTYYNEDVVESKTELSLSDFNAHEVNGWTAGDINFTPASLPLHGKVSVIYTQNPEHTYNVIFADGTPEGAYVRVNYDKQIGKDDDDKTYTTNLTLQSYNFSASSIDGYDSEVTLDGLTATVTYTKWPEYHVVVTGTTDENAGVTYNGTFYGNGRDIVSKWFYTSNLKVVPILYYAGTFDYNESTKTITVNYEKVDYIEISANRDGDWGQNKTVTVADVTVSGYNNGSCYDIYNGGPMTVTSAGAAITKIQLFDNSDATIYNLYGNGSLLVNNTWTANSSVNEVVFTRSDWSDTYVKTVRVWLAKPVEYTVNFVDAPDGATISVDGVSGTFANGGKFTIAKNLTKDDITATSFDGYKYEVTVEDGIITVAYKEVVAPREAEISLEWKGSGTYNFGEDFYTVMLSGFSSNRNGAASFNGGNTITVSTTAGNISKIELVNGLSSAFPFDANSFTVDKEGETSAPTSESFIWNSTSTDEVNRVTFTTSGSTLAIGKVIVTLGDPIQPIEYTVVFSPADLDGASVTIGDNTATPTNNTFTVAKNFNKGDVTDIVEPTGWYADEVTYRDHTFYVTYHEYDQYTVFVNIAGGRAVVDGAEYANNTTVDCKGEPADVSYKNVENYDGEVVVDNNAKTITVTYTAWPTWTVNITSPAGSMGSVTVDGVQYYDKGTFQRKELAEGDVTASRIPLNGADITINQENHTVTVIYQTLPTGDLKFDLASNVYPTPGDVERCPNTITIYAPDGVTFDYTEGQGLSMSLKVNGQYKAFFNTIMAYSNRITIPTDGFVLLGDLKIEIPAGTFKGTYVSEGTTYGTTHEDCTLSYTVPYQYTIALRDKNGNIKYDETKKIVVDGVEYNCGVLINGYAAPVTAKANKQLTDGDVTAEWDGYETAVSVTPVQIKETQEAYGVERTVIDGAITITYTKLPEYADFANVASNHRGTNRVLSSVELHFKEAITWNRNYDEVKEGSITFNGEAVSANNLMTSFEDGYEKRLQVTFPEVTETGTYDLVIPKGMFVLRTVGGEPVLNNEFRIQYVVESYEYIDIAATVSEKNGKTISGIASDVLTFDRKVKHVWGRPTLNTRDLGVVTTYSAPVKENDDKGDEPKFSDPDNYDVMMNVEMPAQTEDGTYTLTFAKGLIEFFDGTWNNEFSVTYTVTTPALVVKSSGWTTFCLDVPFSLPEGYSARTVTGENDLVLTLTEVVGVIPANTGILVKGEDGFTPGAGVAYTKHLAATDFADVSGNMLYPALVAENIADDPDHLYYRLSLNAANEAGSIGFYWHSNSADGHSMQMTAHKAYLILDTPADGGASNVRIRGFETQSPTSIDSLFADEDVRIYDLKGNRVSRENLRSGVYVVNGRKVVVK